MSPIDERPPRQPAPTERTGVAPPVAEATDWDQTFRDDLAADVAVEASLLIKEGVIVAIIVLLVLLREVLL